MAARELYQVHVWLSIRKYAFKKVRPLDGILRVKKVRVLTRSIYFLNLTQPRLAPKLDGVMLVAWNGRGDASGDRRTADAVTETLLSADF